MTFDSVLKRAALMGLNIQSDEFWELRPDYFIIMSDAYEIREQQRWLPFRRLMSVIVSVNGGKVEEADFINLSHFDKPKNIKNYKVPSYEEAMAFTNELIKNGNLKA